MDSDAIFLNAGSIATAAAMNDEESAVAPKSALPSNPFVGLRPFESEESVLFFGRDKQLVELMQQLHRTRFLAVVGSSGCGKSSLIRAGLIPKLKAGFLVERRDRWRIATMKPGDAPLKNMAAALLKVGSESPGEEEVDALVSAMRVGGAGAVLERLAAQLERDGASLLLLVDQFEELFRYGDSFSGDERREVEPEEAEPDEKAASSAAEERLRVQASKKIRRRDEAMRFVSIMLELARLRDVPIYVVMTMRSDFLGDCDAFHGLPEAINESIYLVPRLSRQQRQDAAENPVRLYGQTVAPRLLDRVVNDVGDEPDQLPVMQHALMRTWEEWKKDHAEGEAIDLRHYEAAGTFFGALSLDADNALAEMQPDEQIIAERMFQMLVDTDAQGRRVRRPAHLGEIAEVTGAPPREVLGVVDYFRRGGRCFLMLSSERADDDPLVDISHESFIRQWKKLSEWVSAENESKEQYTRLATAALRHKAGVAALWTDPELQSALKWWDDRAPNEPWARRYSPAFVTAHEFLSASKDNRVADERDRARRQLEEIESEKLKHQNERLRRFSIALILLVLLALGGGGSAIVAFVRATKSEHRANEEKMQADVAKQKAVGLTMELKDSLANVQAAKDEAEQRRVEAEKAVLKAKEAGELAKLAQTKAEEEKKRAQAETVRADQQAHIAINEAAAAKKAKEDLRIANESKVSDMNKARKELLGKLGGLYQQAISLSDDAEQEEQVLQTYEQILVIYDKDEVPAGKLSTLLLLGKRLDRSPDDVGKKKALGYYERSLDLFDLSDITQRAEKISTLNKMGDILNHMKSPDSAGAAKRYEEAISFALETPQTENLTKRVYQKLGDIYTASGTREQKLKAVELYDKEMAFLDADILRADKNPDDNLKPGELNPLKLDLLIQMGTLRYRLGQPQKAEDLFKRAVEFSNADESSGGAAPTLVRIGLRLNLPGEARDQEKYFAKALDPGASKGPAAKASTYFTIGFGLSRQGKYEAALPYLAEAEKIYRETAVDRRRQASTLLYMGNAYRSLGKKEEALDHYRRTLKIYEELKLTNFVSNVNRMIKETETGKQPAGSNP